MRSCDQEPAGHHGRLMACTCASRNACTDPCAIPLSVARHHESAPRAPQSTLCLCSRTQAASISDLPDARLVRCRCLPPLATRSRSTAERTPRPMDWSPERSLARRAIAESTQRGAGTRHFWGAERRSTSTRRGATDCCTIIAGGGRGGRFSSSQQVAELSDWFDLSLAFLSISSHAEVHPRRGSCEHAGDRASLRGQG